MYEMPIYPLQANFARGEVSPQLFGRVDLSAYSSGLRTLRNFFVRPEGPVSNRPGFQFTGNALTNATKGSILLPFVFSVTQSYLIEVGAGSAQVFSGGSLVTATGANITSIFVTHIIPSNTWSTTIVTATPHGLTLGQNFNIAGVIATGACAVNGTWQVTSVSNPTQLTIYTGLGGVGTYGSGGVASTPLFFATPWAAADLPKLRYAQSTDTLTIVHPNYPPYEIKRTSANSFTCLAAVYTQGPFLQQNTDGTTFVYASGVTGTVTLTSTAPIFNANQVGGLMQLTQQDLSIIPPWEPSKKFTDASGNNTNPIQNVTYRRSNLKNYKCVGTVQTGASASGSFATGTNQPAHNQGTQPDGDGSSVPNLATVCGMSWQYQDSGYGVVLITGFISSTQVTAVVQPNYVGGPGLLPQAVVGGVATVSGPFTFTATAGQTAFSPMTGNAVYDTTKFYVTVNGVYVSPSLYVVTSTTPTTLTFLTGRNAGDVVVIRGISQLGQTSYWAFGAFSIDQGFPQAVTYYPDRLVLASTPKQPVGVFGSQTSQYHNFTVSNPVVASDAFTAFLNARQLNAISDLIPLSDLLVGTSNIIWRLWPGSTGTALGPLAIKADPQNTYGEAPSCAAVLYGDSAIFAEYDGRRLRDLIYQFAYDKFQGQELTLYSRHLIPFGTQMTRLAYKPDPAGQILFALRSDGALLCCTYLREQQVTGWARWDTQGTFEDVCVVPEGTSYALYCIVNRTINGVAMRYVERLASREVKTVYDYQFLDCCLTYDGRNTSATTMTFSGGSSFLAGDSGVITASGTTGWANFLASDLNNEIWLYDAAGARCRCFITSVRSTTQIFVRLKDPIPADLLNAPVSTWTFAKTNFGGATQLAGMQVVALVDSNTYGISNIGTSPNGQLVVANDGSVTLPVAGGVVQVGLSYLSDFETLSLNDQGQATIRMRAKSNPAVFLDVTETRNFIAGTDFVSMYPNAERAFETYISPTALQEGIVWTRMPSSLDSECHTCVRQNMPLPITIRMHIPQVTVGDTVN